MHEHCIPKHLIVGALEVLKFKAASISHSAEAYARARNIDAAYQLSDQSKILMETIRFIEMSCLTEEKESE
jgi:hypothetical protein